MATGPEFVTVGKTADIPVGQCRPAAAGDKRLLVCHTEHGFSVVDDTCTHDGGPLGEGILDGTAIECPRHGARFDVTTGAVLCLPAAVGIRSYPVRVEGADVKAQVA